ncbi:hypothetical protein PQX77_015260 [Marasmius sp. AFHP31]|nr:hypothetical protein PQX77_015260 [Marasmius sp. AFHP31]
MTVKSNNKKGPPGIQANSLKFDSSLGQTTQELSINSIRVVEIESDSDQSVGFDDMPALQDVSDTESEGDQVYSLQYISDTETTDSEDDSSSEGEIWYEAHSLFDDNTDNEDGVVLNRESDWENFPDYSEFVNEYNLSRSRIRPVVENQRPQPTDEEIMAQVLGEEIRLWFADEAKLYFGYPDSPWSDFYVQKRIDPSFCPDMIGNWYTEAAEFILEHHAPYPGDESRWGSTSSHRINVFQLDAEMFEINDLESEQGPILLPADLMLNLEFQLAAWYAKRRAEEQGLPWNNYPEFHGCHNSKVGDPYLKGIKLVLSHGVPRFPESENSDDSCDPYWRFSVKTRDEGEERYYLIYDEVEDLVKSVPSEYFDDPFFDLIGWWSNQILDHRELKAFELANLEAELARIQKRTRCISNRRRWKSRHMGDIVARAVKQRL